MFVIKKKGSSLFVTSPGSGRSYTRDISKAATFSTPESAKASGVCENECIAAIEGFLQTPS